MSSSNEPDDLSLGPEGIHSRLKKLCDLFEHSKKDFQHLRPEECTTQQSMEILTRLDVLHSSVYRLFANTKKRFRENKNRREEASNNNTSRTKTTVDTTDSNNENLNETANLNGTANPNGSTITEITPRVTRSQKRAAELPMQPKPAKRLTRASRRAESIQPVNENPTENGGAQEEQMEVDNTQTAVNSSVDAVRNLNIESQTGKENRTDLAIQTENGNGSAAANAENGGTSKTVREQIVELGLEKSVEKKLLTVPNMEACKSKEPDADWRRGLDQLLNDDIGDLTVSLEDQDVEDEHQELGASDLSDHPEDLVRKKKKKKKEDVPEEVILSSDEEIVPPRRRRKEPSDEDEDQDSEEDEDEVPKKSKKSRTNVILSDDEEENSDEESEEDDESALSVVEEDEELEELLRTRINNSSDEDEEESNPGPCRRSRRLAKTQDSKEKKSKAVSDAVNKRKRVTLGSDSDDVFNRQGSSSSPDFINDSQESNAQKTNPLEKKKGKRRRRQIVDTDDELMEEDEEEQAEPETSEKEKATKAKKGRLCKDTRDAEKEERERVKRLAEKQKDFNGILIDEAADAAAASGAGTIAGPVVQVVLDEDTASENPEPVKVPPELVRVLKKHQAHGIKFLYDLTIEDLKRLDLPGGGGILAHCMGLGKTLQVIAFLYTILSHSKINKVIRKALVVVPKNVVINWEKEFEKWVFENNLKGIDVVSIEGNNEMHSRLQVLKDWKDSKNPAVMIIGYEMYRILVTDPFTPNKKGVKPKPTPARRLHKKLLSGFQQYLQDPGPDIVICDEGHKLKNDESKQSLVMASLRTKRRVCLTGTPMQNNLLEYHCMINFVKPGLLGTKEEYTNRFVNVIKAGQAKDAEYEEVVAMKRRCHVLFQKLKKVVDRQDYRVLTEFIPPKQEYIIHVRLTEKQISLYQGYVAETMKDVAGLHRRLLSDYHMLSRIWTHPFQLVVNARNKARDESDMDSFIDDTEDDSDGETRKKPKQRNNFIDDEVDNTEERDANSPFRIPLFWYEDLGLISDEDEFKFGLSQKLMILQDIIRTCEQIGDKLLIFSQSLESLTLIQHMLEHLSDSWFSDHQPLMQRNNEKWGWDLGKDFFIISGKLNAEERERVQKRFNDSSKPRARVCLISTKAGSLGTNMVAANRVVIFDACWNPSHDTQALFRAYRYGQTKPVYVYRLIADGTLEDVIYKRQVTKESTSLRVVDEKQIKRFFTRSDLAECYRLDIHPYNPDLTVTLNPPKDRLLGDILVKRPEAIYNYEERDTLLKHVVEEVLTEKERREAWNDYEKDRTAATFISKIGSLNMQQSEREFLISMGQFVRHQSSSSNPMVDPIRTNLGKTLLDHGCDYHNALALQILQMGFSELMGKGPQNIRQEHPELIHPDEFIVRQFLSHPPSHAYELTMLDCRNKFKDLHRKYAHLDSLKTTFQYLSKLRYLLTDYNMPATDPVITI
ncbi:unnamed protein product [Bursaphelenchus xylophilus]|uniref:(pine wood nematode) hypothetical protein n=1 Tax=Bursaphelenchus xylophilus TaxID=6326 RepID=A0A1I7RLF7_BURXY|nr:unnamed protein product [Bursaphelenchus xylophilus]CAG9083035.1 unnamed protein product [Bursaphelenchus xylophilus]